ncbi:patatin-like phospholipase family protein [Streptomyces sp. NBC_00582]|uniref:patatin-like phospholipase family protein n=1 Tax=Streptomyces sp. NBC_00582 TaxID=2975783 RepID=UPI002E802BAF|nr:patatin-like phospholipase family protein [Streptomyces sp. NBC_00582]WUB63568.1 patatin-like phospholipase family protein [Streptomyces sp. NBC_00582]
MTSSTSASSPPLSVGLVLSSGAALGAAHAGVLRAVEEAGIAVSAVAGTSAGALIGGAWAAGVDSARLTERLLRAQWADFGRAAISPRLGLLDTSPLARNIEDMVGDLLIEDLPTRFGAVVTELGSTTPRLVTSGSFTAALRASSAVPGLFPPVRLEDGGALCVDGAVVSPLPVWAAHRLGAGRVIAVGFGRGTTRWRRWFESRPAHPAQGRLPDLTITIDTAGHSPWSPTDVPSLIERGYEATREALRTWPRKPTEPGPYGTPPTHA